MSRDAYELPFWSPIFPMSVATLAATMSPCVRSQVGAAMRGETDIVWACNAIPGLSVQIPCLERCPRGQRTYAEVPTGAPFSGPGGVPCVATHAEQGVCEEAEKLGWDVRGLVMVVTHAPCVACATQCGQAGIFVWGGEDEWQRASNGALS